MPTPRTHLRELRAWHPGAAMGVAALAGAGFTAALFASVALLTHYFLGR